MLIIHWQPEGSVTRGRVDPGLRDTAKHKQSRHATKAQMTSISLCPICGFGPAINRMQRALGVKFKDKFTNSKTIDKIDYLYNHNVMEQLGYTNTQSNLDAIFAALADPTRRAILSRLVDGQASVNEIAAPFEMSQPAVSRHLKVLERAGLIERNIDEQRRPARLKAQTMAAAVDWLTEFKAFWGTSFDQLDNVLLNMKQAEAKETGHE